MVHTPRRPYLHESRPHRLYASAPRFHFVSTSFLIFSHTWTTIYVTTYLSDDAPLRDTLFLVVCEVDNLSVTGDSTTTHPVSTLHIRPHRLLRTDTLFFQHSVSMWKTVCRSKGAASAMLSVRCRPAMCCRALLGTRSSFLSGVVSTTGPVLVMSGRRWCATTPPHGTGSSGSQSIDEEAVVRAAKWSSSNFEERLGFRTGETITEERLKRHYRILAKHYHPDTAAGSGRGSGVRYEGETSAGKDVAFQNIKEAYDVVNAAVKRGGRRGGNASRGSATADFAGGFEFSDEARRRSQMRLLGDAVLLFIFMTVAFIVVVSSHNKSRMQSRYLWHLVGIFFIIQLFPRLFAAAILFAVHSMHLLEKATLQEQAAISLIVERTERICSVQLEGLRTEAQPNVVVQVTTTADANNDAAERVSSTLTFDKGVTAFTLPLPVDSSCVYHVKAVDEARKIVLVDRSLSARMPATV
ncbi:conserved hypothetical protein [Leishmania mexicana MHOM/GT/2001/U1103]|uniref:J domain-containing protein n=1 Tax=Leishmania mexicana (strain MHOM/GT/2001/U1103) TaxID=929439 RepID=E9ASQ2_LEIMU|nr:conserved hypothetical protein [Leishmania mexicana MHOM/GT/2001/U1103]CBZ25976.1 conserved hypothetical protein [Leishmania mexicana MHOM/GT/2001/U1103]